MTNCKADAKECAKAFGLLQSNYHTLSNSALTLPPDEALKQLRALNEQGGRLVIAVGWMGAIAVLPDGIKDGAPVWSKHLLQTTQDPVGIGSFPAWQAFGRVWSQAVEVAVKENPHLFPGTSTRWDNIEDGIGTSVVRPDDDCRPGIAADCALFAVYCSIAADRLERGKGSPHQWVPQAEHDTTTGDVATASTPDAIDEKDLAILAFLAQRANVRRKVADVLPDDGPQDRKAIAARLRKLADRTPPLVDYPKGGRSGVAILRDGVAALEQATTTTPR